jgi:hypothetical protein
MSQVDEVARGWSTAEGVGGLYLAQQGLKRFAGAKAGG